jgi:hypothetical protein
MLSDLIRLSDSDIEKAFQLSYAILVDEDLATQATIMSLSALSLEANEERARLKRILKKRFSRIVSSDEIEINYRYLLQTIVLEKTTRFEKGQEREIGARLHEHTWLLRYFKNIISFSNAAEHTVTVGYCRVIHDYSREVAQRVYTFLVQKRDKTKSLEDFSKWKTRIDKNVRQRFQQILREKTVKGNVRRFIASESAEEKKHYAIACLKFLKPWAMSCALPNNFSESSAIPALVCNSNNLLKEQLIKDRRVATVLDYECFKRLMGVFDRLAPRDHLLIPQFNLPQSDSDVIPPADLNNLPALSPQRLDRIRRHLSQQSIRRQMLMPRWVRIVVDGEMLEEHDLYRTRDMYIPLKDPVDTIELWAIDSEGLIPLTFKTLSSLKPSSPKATTFSTKLEAGQKILWKIVHGMEVDGDLFPSQVLIRYRETNWSRALSFHVRRLQENALPRILPERFSDALHAWLLENERPMNIALRGIPLFIVAIVLFFTARSILRPEQSENIARSSTPSSSASSPSPSTTPRNEVASASPSVKLPPEIPGGPGRTTNGEPILRTGRNVGQKSLTLREVRSIFIDPQSENFKMLLRDSLIVRFTEAGFVTNVEENDADARLSMRETKRGQLIVSLVSGRMQIWSDRLNVRERTPTNAEKLAADLSTRLEEAKKR